MAPLACLVMLLLFARSGLYRDRAQRPGFATVISSLVQVTVVILLYALIEGADFSSYYIFYGSLFFALLYVSFLRWVVRAGERHAAARGGVPPPRGAGGLRGQHRRRLPRAVATARRSSRSASSRSGRGRPTGLRDFGSLECSSATSTRSTRC